MRGSRPWRPSRWCRKRDVGTAWRTEGLSRLPFAPKGEPLSPEPALEEKATAAQARFREGVGLASGIPGGKSAPAPLLAERGEEPWEASPGAFGAPESERLLGGKRWRRWPVWSPW